MNKLIAVNINNEDLELSLTSPMHNNEVVTIYLTFQDAIDLCVDILSKVSAAEKRS